MLCSVVSFETEIFTSQTIRTTVNLIQNNNITYFTCFHHFTISHATFVLFTAKILGQNNSLENQWRRVTYIHTYIHTLIWLATNYSIEVSFSLEKSTENRNQAHNNINGPCIIYINTVLLPRLRYIVSSVSLVTQFTLIFCLLYIYIYMYIYIYILYIHFFEAQGNGLLFFVSRQCRLVLRIFTVETYIL